MSNEKWKIGKEFNFEYGHRVSSQSLNPEYSIDDRCMCRHLHGHSGKVIVYLEGNKLDERGYFCDFKELNWFKKFVDDILDHKMIIDVNDPGIHHIVPQWDKVGPTLKAYPEGYQTIGPYWFKFVDDDVLKEVLEGFVFVNFVPTSENICKWLHGIVQEKMGKINVQCTQVQFFETAKSQCTYFSK